MRTWVLIPALKEDGLLSDATIVVLEVGEVSSIHS